MKTSEKLRALADKPLNWYSLNCVEHRLQLRALAAEVEALERDSAVLTAVLEIVDLMQAKIDAAIDKERGE